jgi:predicted CXXCH cytochrome family protein
MWSNRRSLSGYSVGPRPASIAILALTVAVTGAAAAPERAAAPPAAGKAAPAGSSNEARFHLKPGASGKLCLACHADFQEVVRRASVHTPVKSGQCTGCHSPHATDHGKMLAASPDAVCATCHAGLVPGGAASVHRPVAEGRCVSCHDPHASPNNANLIRAGNTLCLGCHADVKSSVESATHKHPPADRNCLACHDPHAAKGAKAILRKAAPALCLDCHKPTQPGFAQAHMNYPVSKADCTSCHDPHGSKNRGILRATVHEPVRNRMCAQCHGDPAAQRVTLKRPGADLCRGCHNALILDIGSKTRVHWPVLDKTACANCHEPHASRTPGLLKAPQKRLCGGCHQDAVARQDRSPTKHAPVNDGECTSCHQPHASDATFLFASADTREVCGACHDWAGHSAHPLGDKAVDQRNPNLRVDCLSCHRSHGTPFKHFAHGDVKGELCMGCHTQITR